MSASHPSQPLKNIQIREILEHFRILVIGNANAGKTTILSKVCNGKIEEDLKPSNSRGEHDIEDEIVYPTAHGFIFHDSRGFESGTSSELDKVKAFIAGRAKRAELKDQLHAIWYCLPTSGDRSLTEAEMSLFKCGTGNVPVIAIFTKMDAIDTKVFNELKKSHSFKEAKSLTASVARTKFEQDFLKPLGAVEHKPARIVELRNMDKPEANCKELVLSTAQALDSKALKLLLLSSHRNNVKYHIELAISQVIMPLAQETLKSELFAEEQQQFLLCGIAVYFPHILPSFNKVLLDMDRNVISATVEAVSNSNSRVFDRVLDDRVLDDRVLDDNVLRLLNVLRLRNRVLVRDRVFDVLLVDDDKFFEKCSIKLSSLVQDMIVSLSPFHQVISFGAVFIIALEYSLYAASALSSYALLEALDLILKAWPLQMLLLELQAEFVEPCSTIDDDAPSKIFCAIKAHSLVDINA